MDFLKEHFLALLVGGVGLICLGYSLIYLLPQRQQEQDFSFASGSDASASVKNDKSSVKKKEISIDIAGAVQKPGVYKMPDSSRIEEAIAIAGGLAKDADKERIAKEVNLAAKLTDGAKLYLPVIGEQTTKTTEDASVDTSTSTININSATSSQLEELPGIGEVTAGKIISGRPYAAIEELVSKQAVGQSVFEKIKGQVSVY